MKALQVAGQKCPVACIPHVQAFCFEHSFLSGLQPCKMSSGSARLQYLKTQSPELRQVCPFQLVSNPSDYKEVSYLGVSLTFTLGQCRCCLSPCPGLCRGSYCGTFCLCRLSRQRYVPPGSDQNEPTNADDEIICIYVVKYGQY